jgi:hypothetical protein
MRDAAAPMLFTLQAFLSGVTGLSPHSPRVHSTPKTEALRPLWATGSIPSRGVTVFYNS